MNCTRFLIVICSLLVLSPLAASALTFTLSDDAIMALDYNDHDYYYRVQDVHMLTIKDVNGSGVQFDILFSNPYDNRGQGSYLEWISSVRGGNGILAKRDISMFDAFALKFTFLSAEGISTHDHSGFVTVGALYNWAMYPEDIAINLSNPPVYPYPPVSALSLTTIYDSHQMWMVGFTCYIPYSYYDGLSMSPPWDPNGVIVSILVEPAPGAVVMTSDPNQVFQLISIDKCTVTAGRKEGSDRISFSGKMNPVYTDLDLTNVIQIAVGSGDMSKPCVVMIPTPGNDNYKKAGKYSYSGIDENGVKKSFKLDFKTHRFSFAAQNINLTGLSCPVNVGVDITDFHADTNVDETIVNGPKKLIPISLLMGVKNSLRVGKLKVKHGKTDSLAVNGEFSAQKADVNMATDKLSVALGLQTFTIPAKSLRPNKTVTKFTCSDVKLDGDTGTASATFDFSKCTFAVTIKNTTIDASLGNTANFAVEFTDFNESTDIVIP